MEGTTTTAPEAQKVLSKWTRAADVYGREQITWSATRELDGWEHLLETLKGVTYTKRPESPGRVTLVLIHGEDGNEVTCAGAHRYVADAEAWVATEIANLTRRIPIHRAALAAFTRGA